MSGFPPELTSLTEQQAWLRAAADRPMGDQRRVLRDQRLDHGPVQIRPALHRQPEMEPAGRCRLRVGQHGLLAPAPERGLVEQLRRGLGLQAARAVDDPKRFAFHNRGVADTANDKTGERRMVPDGNGTQPSPYTMAATDGQAKTLDQVSFRRARCSSSCTARAPRGTRRPRWTSIATCDEWIFVGPQPALPGHCRRRPVPGVADRGRPEPPRQHLPDHRRHRQRRQQPAVAQSRHCGHRAGAVSRQPRRRHASASRPDTGFSLLPPALQTAATTTNVSIDRIIWLANVKANARPGWPRAGPSTRT